MIILGKGTRFLVLHHVRGYDPYLTSDNRFEVPVGAEVCLAETYKCDHRDEKLSSISGIIDNLGANRNPAPLFEFTVTKVPLKDNPKRNLDQGWRRAIAGITIRWNILIFTGNYLQLIGNLLGEGYNNPMESFARECSL